MKKNLKRLTAVLLASILLLPVFGRVPAFAAAAKSNEKLVFVTVNPLYADEVTAENILDRIAKVQEEAAAEGELEAPDSFHAPFFSDVASAGAYLASQGVLRKTTIQFRYPTYYNGIISEFEEQTFRHTGVSTEGDYLYAHYLGNSISISMDSDGNYLFTYELSYATTKAQEDTLTQQIEALKQELGLSTLSGEYAVRAVYQYIVDNITYDYANLNDDTNYLKFSAYAALVNKTAVCNGYAALLYRILLELGIDARIITGFASGGRHAWNIIKLGSYYYNADSTWDAGGYMPRYFLKAQAAFTDHARESKWNTAAFHESYPMAPTDYVFSSAAAPDVTAAENQPKGIRVAWTTVYDASKYRLSRRESSSDAGWTNLTTTTKTAYFDSSAKSGTKYEYKVQAQTNSSWGSFGKSLTVWRNPFNDISEARSWFSSVMWAVRNGITSGINPTTFWPDGICTRYQFAVMLYRLAGKPEVSADSLPFADVASDASYRKAVAWAYSNGIISGTSATTFSPDDGVARYQVVQMLYKAAGKPAVNVSSNPFTDVSPSNSYYKAVMWAVENNITSGTTATTFSPKTTCPRYQMVIFLNRFNNIYHYK